MLINLIPRGESGSSNSRLLLKTFCLISSRFIFALGDYIAVAIPGLHVFRCCCLIIKDIERLLGNNGWQPIEAGQNSVESVRVEACAEPPINPHYTVEVGLTPPDPDASRRSLQRTGPS
ncbi:hypothetical protein RRG08_027010 [Elysia crispata]|uniref:Uncharacterized protein n=1 Tax=Elysia crispata TaxID=231223 RepID=A0AAE1AJG8_9GAST|nr:hypothetical protein RRG08_027010 [Elysia crispata]